MSKNLHTNPNFLDIKFSDFFFHRWSVGYQYRVKRARGVLKKFSNEMVVFEAFVRPRTLEWKIFYEIKLLYRWIVWVQESTPPPPSYGTKSMPVLWGWGKKRKNKKDFIIHGKASFAEKVKIPQKINKGGLCYRTIL